MELDQKILTRFNELANQAASIPIRRDDSGFHSVHRELFYKWVSSAINLVSMVFGKDSHFCLNLDQAHKEFQGWEEDFLKARGIFLSAKSDYEGGFFLQIETAITGEIFIDFVKAAKQALGEGQKDVAAVLACAALEDTLKRYAILNGLNVEEKTMQDVVNALKAKGLVSGAQKSLLDTMPKIRNFAMHADWGKITPQDVGSVIGYVEQFLLSNF
jgi:hypothetical protein